MVGSFIYAKDLIAVSQTFLVNTSYCIMFTCFSCFVHKLGVVLTLFPALLEFLKMQMWNKMDQYYGS